LDKLLQKQAEQAAAAVVPTPAGLKARVVRWRSGEDIADWLQCIGLLS
jgi:hypothetical protein